MHTQNDEESVIKAYFADHDLKSLFLLDIGANDGETFSNSRQLILDGWNAVLVEPSPKAYDKLNKLYALNPKVNIKKVAISQISGEVVFHESGSWNKDKSDIALLSSIKESELKRWGNRVTFKKIKVQSLTFEDFLQYENLREIKFNFISIDAEGVDWEILEQIDLTKIGCQCLCVEWNGIPEMYSKMKAYCASHGMREHSKNGENLIFIR
jgi:FkbM family methyltransferase